MNRSVVSSSSVRLFSYKLTHDGGFAPNPFWGFLTLATCKPQIRLHKHPGDWIAGFTSTALCADAVGQERLIYLMQVDRKLKIAQYFRDPEFAKKIPVRHSARHVERVGDNIYRPKNASASAPSDFRQVPNDSHYDGAKSCTVGESQRHDLSGVYVLIASRFAYFGGMPLLIPSALRPDVPVGQSAHGMLTRDGVRASRFIDFVFERSAGRRVLSAPHGWESDDESWRDADAGVAKAVLRDRGFGSVAKGCLRRRGCS